MNSIWLGYDARETHAYVVARESIAKHNPESLPVHSIILHRQQQLGNYTRPYKRFLGGLYDNISAAPMSTEFAITRFLTPLLAVEGWALFMDCDVMVRSDLTELFALADDRYAVMCVKHEHKPVELTKMDNCVQQEYARKNWSSVMLFNCGHRSNLKLTKDLINSARGADLHRFCWLCDDEIGELGKEWNYLVGYTKDIPDPKIVHFTSGVPCFAEHESDEYSDEWFHYLYTWANQ